MEALGNSGENDWRDEPPEENDGHGGRDRKSEAQDVIDRANRALCGDWKALVRDVRHQFREWRAEDDPLGDDAADAGTDVAEAEGHPS